jgi:hypothetical protein
MFLSFDIPFISHNIARASVLNMPPGLNGIIYWHHTKFVTVKHGHSLVLIFG